MKVSDYIVNFLIQKGVKHFYGYQGTMIAHLIDSICKNPDAVNHCCYNEQGASFSAVGEAKVSQRCAVAYSTSGPGIANMVSGIADAFYDSVPVIFFAGQINVYEYTKIPQLRQQGFQQMNVTSMVESFTKYCVKVDNPEDVPYELGKAWHIANTGRKGPVVIDLPMNVQRSDIDVEKCRMFTPTEFTYDDINVAIETIISALKDSKRPVLLLGNGILKDTKNVSIIKSLVTKHNIPVVTSLLGRDILPYDFPLNFGYIGSAYGHRNANLMVYKKADLIVSLGCSMCRRQTGGNTSKFAQGSKIIRVDVDTVELSRKVHEDEISIVCDANQVIRLLESKFNESVDYSDWVEVCNIYKREFEKFDNLDEFRKPNKFVETISETLNDVGAICVDVGQHMMWAGQSYRLKEGQKLLFSGGHGAMGFSLPASIGAYYSTHKPVVCIAGDGAFQMNVQELQWIYREQIPVTMLIMNNNSLGLIRQQQDDFFDGNHFSSTAEHGYTVPSFVDIAKAYKIDAYSVSSIEELSQVLKTIDTNKPNLVEVFVGDDSKAYPKTWFGEEMFNQRPYYPKDDLDRLLNL